MLHRPTDQGKSWPRRVRRPTQLFTSPPPEKRSHSFKRNARVTPPDPPFPPSPARPPAPLGRRRGDDAVLVDAPVNRRPGHAERPGRADLVTAVVEQALHDRVPLDRLQRRPHPAAAPPEPRG